MGRRPRYYNSAFGREEHIQRFREWERQQERRQQERRQRLQPLLGYFGPSTERQERQREQERQLRQQRSDFGLFKLLDRRNHNLNQHCHMPSMLMLPTLMETVAVSRTVMAFSRLPSLLLHHRPIPPQAPLVEQWTKTYPRLDLCLPPAHIKECVVDGELVTIELIDTLGPGYHDDYFEKDVMDAYIDRGDGFLLIYSADHPKSLEMAKENYNRGVRIKRYERESATNPIPGMLVAVRVEEEDKALRGGRGNKLAEMDVAFMQVSLKNGRNVDEVFIHIARLIKRHQERKKRISNIRWAYYDQKVLDDRHENGQESDGFRYTITTKERTALTQVDYGSGLEEERCVGCCTGCVIA